MLMWKARLLAALAIVAALADGFFAANNWNW